MCGAGKSVVADEFVKAGFEFIRFGQITLDICQERGVSGETAEKEIREALRVEHGPAVFAKLNISKFDELLKKSHVIGDGLYSWSEYKVLKERYGDNMQVVAVWAPPALRYERISQRHSDKNDTSLRNRNFSMSEAKARDYAEIENIEKGGPIVMADFTLKNDTSLQNLKDQIKQLLTRI